MNLHILSITFLISLIKLNHAGTVGCGKPCLLNTDCRKGLACDVRIHPISNTCLFTYGGSCVKDLDCVNNLNCMNGRCKCYEGYYLDADRNDCFPVQKFGEACQIDHQCNTSMVCASRGPLVDVCLQDKGGLCSQDKDCANEQKCLDGRCGCLAQYEVYNHHNHDCDMIRYQNEGLHCATSNDCNSKNLACDNSVNGNKTQMCARIYAEFCQDSNDCANGLNCIDNMCQCKSNQFYDQNSNDCFYKKQLNEPCIENFQCSENLVCDVRVGRSPISELRKMVCLKDLNIQCKNNSECANYLPCNDGICGCRVGFFYNSELKDCFAQQDFGQPCKTNNECGTDLACDLSPTGSQTNTCANLVGGRCSENSDCANSLECVKGFCGCKDGKSFNRFNNECESYEHLVKEGLLTDLKL